MFEENKEYKHYYTELAKAFNEALGLLKEASIQIDDQDLSNRMDEFFDYLDQKKKSA